MKIFCKDIPEISWEKKFEYQLNKSIHLWKVDVDNDPKIISELKKNLDYDELKRSERFAFEKDRNQFITAHGMLRNILSRYMDFSPSQIQFKRTSNGKPYVHFPTTFIKFNISHSENLILIALADHEIGIDLEKVKDSFEYNELSKTYFSHHEQKEITSSPLPKKTFYKLWTRKEAVLKASGIGITDELKNIEICFSENNASLSNDFYVSTFPVENSYASIACLANKPVQFFYI